MDPYSDTIQLTTDISWNLLDDDPAGSKHVADA
jgi:hypothetical protein